MLKTLINEMLNQNIVLPNQVFKQNSPMKIVTIVLNNLEQRVVNLTKQHNTTLFCMKQTVVFQTVIDTKSFKVT